MGIETEALLAVRDGAEAVVAAVVQVTGNNAGVACLQIEVVRVFEARAVVAVDGKIQRNGGCGAEKRRQDKRENVQKSSHDRHPHKLIDLNSAKIKKLIGH